MPNAFNERSLGFDYPLALPMEPAEMVAAGKSSGVRNLEFVRSDFPDCV